MNIALRFHFQIFVDAIDFVNEHFKLNRFIHFVRLENGFIEFSQCLDVVIVSVDNEYKRIASLEYYLRVECRIEKVNLAWKIPQLKLHE